MVSTFEPNSIDLTLSYRSLSSMNIILLLSYARQSNQIQLVCLVDCILGRLISSFQTSFLSQSLMQLFVPSQIFSRFSLFTRDRMISLDSLTWVLFTNDLLLFLLRAASCFKRSYSTRRLFFWLSSKKGGKSSLVGWQLMLSISLRMFVTPFWKQKPQRRKLRRKLFHSSSIFCRDCWCCCRLYSALAIYVLRASIFCLSAAILVAWFVSTTSCVLLFLAFICLLMFSWSILRFLMSSNSPIISSFLALTAFENRACSALWKLIFLKTSSLMEAISFSQKFTRSFSTFCLTVCILAMKQNQSLFATLTGYESLSMEVEVSKRFSQLLYQ